MSYFRVNENCNGCLSCMENCPAAALSVVDRDGRRTLKHNMTRCARCGQCWRVCPERAIEFQHLMVGEWDDVITLDLIHCRVCGEALYSPSFGQKMESKLNSPGEALCTKHRQRNSAAMWPSMTTGKAKPNLGGK